MAALASRPCLVGLLGAVCLQLGAAPGPAAQRDAGDGCVAGQALVRFCADLSEQGRREVLSQSGLSRVGAVSPLHIELVTGAADLPGDKVLALLDRSPGVLWAEPNFLCRVALAAPDDPAYSELVGDLYVQWPAHALDALAGWSWYPGWYFSAADRPQDSPVVALIDTGVDTSHPDFMNPGAGSADVSEGGQLLLSAAHGFLSGDTSAPPSDVRDEHGHGTHLAGIIAAGTDNGTTVGSGIAGIAYPVRLLPLKVARENGVATHADIAAAVVYAADEGATAIVIGFVGPTWSRTLQEAVDYAWDRGCFLIAPAGDAGTGGPAFPAGCPHVFGVAALTASGSAASYSTGGDHVAVAAPGGDEVIGVYSTLPTYPCTLRQELTTPPYGWLYGTSQAAAHVGAAAGLYAGLTGIRPETGDEGYLIWQALEESAAAGGRTGSAWSPECGYGMPVLSRLLVDAGGRGDGLGSIVGRVLLHGDSAAGASVTATAADGGPAATVSAAWPTGAYRIANLPPEVYSVTAEAEQLTAEREEIAVLAGCDTPGVDFRLGDPIADADLVSAAIPAAAVRGKSVEVEFRFENTGEATWRRGDGFRLEQVACQSPICSLPDHLGLALGEAIRPGEERSFRISTPVPDACGFYGVAWQMCQQGGFGAFGAVAQGTVSVTSFLDVPADHWAIGAIEAVKEAGFVLGYEGDLCHPAWPVSRDQMAVYLARALAGGEESVPPGPEQATFTDVSRDHWAYQHIEYICARGVVEGYSDGSYHPEYLLDRAQMAVFIARALAGGGSGLAAYTPPGTPTFADVPTDSWEYKEVEYLSAGGVVAGYEDHLYHPECVCSRDQIAVYLARAFGLHSDGLPAADASLAPDR